MGLIDLDLTILVCCTVDCYILNLLTSGYVDRHMLTDLGRLAFYCWHVLNLVNLVRQWASPFVIVDSGADDNGLFLVSSHYTNRLLFADKLQF